MDDIKHFTKADQQLHGLQPTEERFNGDIRMKYGLYSWVKATFIKAKMTESSYVNLEQQDIIKKLEPVKSYKYQAGTQRERIQTFSDVGKDYKIYEDWMLMVMSEMKTRKQ